MAIRVRLAIEPHGDSIFTMPAGEIHIWNARRESEDGTKGVYGYALTGDWKHFEQRIDKGLYAGGSVEIDRVNEGAWQTVAKVIQKVFEDA